MFLGGRHVHIAICDDETEILFDVKNCLDNYSNRKGFDIHVELFNHAPRLLAALDKREYDTFFLDIQMKPIDGLELAREIRRRNAKSPVVFITGLSEHWQEAFHVHAYDFIVKPFSQERINKVLDDLILPQINIKITVNRQQIALPSGEILYLEQSLNKVMFRTETDCYSTYSSFSSQKPLLPSEFCQCHKSYIVNMSKISRKSGNSYILINGEDIPIGRKYAQGFKEEYFSFNRNRE
jgi:DNA-binding LytR/AlgR family response regulator